MIEAAAPGDGASSTPFSAQSFLDRALERGLPLDIALWMTEQPISYGIDAGRAVDDAGEIIDIARLEHIVPAGAWKMSAVLVPIIAREPEVTLLLTLRPSHLHAHAGQVAFPGGKMDATDATPIDTALREAFEEVGLPHALARPLSLLDLHNTGTGYRIVPVIALVDPAFVPTPDPGEVAEVFEIPLSYLMSDANYQRHYAVWKQQRILFNSISYADRFIWGATAAILRNLFERLYGCDHAG